MLLNIAIFVLCFFVFVIGMIGLNRYPDSRHKSKVTRLVFSSVVGFALGLAPVMFIIGTAVGPLTDPISTRILMGLMSLICLLAWILCAVLLSDRSEIDVGSKTTAFIGTMLPFFIIGWLAFGFAAYTGIGSFGSMRLSAPKIGSPSFQQTMQQQVQQFM